MAEQTNDIVLDLEDTNVPHGPVQPGTQSPEQPKEQPAPMPEEDVKRYMKLHQAAEKGDWNAAKEFFDQDSNSLTATISSEGMTVLHVAARNARSEFVEKLVELLPADALAKHDVIYGRTALHYIAAVGKVSAAQKMVMKNRKLPQETDDEGRTPIFAAVIQGLPQSRREMVKFLAKETRDESPSFAFTGELSAQLILGIVANGFYGIALELIERHSNLALAMDEDETILEVIAKDPLAFQSGSKPGFWKDLLYPRTFRMNINRRTESKKKNLVKLVKSVCHSVLTLSDEHMEEYRGSLVAAMHLAAKNDAVELVQEILEAFPRFVWLTQNERLLLHVAIEHRSHKVFNYLLQFTGELRFAFAAKVVEETGNNILHLAATLPSLSRLHSVTGTAFQMQRELQWFQKVEELVPSISRWNTNKEEKTADDLFTESHTKLQEDAQEWMKDTTTSCMVVATLVATIVFAAMITVPGGIHGDTGTPIFLQEISFLVFTVSNGLAVFSSMTSLLVFLSILTSRFAKEDFLESLPKKLIGGLSFLLTAIVTMTIAFAAALHIAIHSKFRLSYIVSIILGCIPVILYLWLHLPLFVEVIKFTWGSGIFKQSDGKHSWITLLWPKEKKE